jgi:hypothetical protein
MDSLLKNIQNDRNERTTDEEHSKNEGRKGDGGDGVVENGGKKQWEERSRCKTVQTLETNKMLKIK